MLYCDVVNYSKYVVVGVGSSISSIYLYELAAVEYRVNKCFEGTEKKGAVGLEAAVGNLMKSVGQLIAVQKVTTQLTNELTCFLIAMGVLYASFHCAGMRCNG